MWQGDLTLARDSSLDDKNTWLLEMREDQLPDSQCGFRKGKGYNTDMCELLEKVYKHNTPGYHYIYSCCLLTYAKYIDSVPQQAM